MFWSADDRDFAPIADCPPGVTITPGVTIAPAVLLWRMGCALPLNVTMVECGWKILENTDAVIRRYRTAILSFDHVGGSVLNSLSDIAAMRVGVWLPVRASVAIGTGADTLTTIAIRDGLVLNVVMPLRPIEAIRVWQAGGQGHGATLCAMVPNRLRPAASSIQIRTSSPGRRNGVCGAPRASVSTIRCSAMQE